MSQAQQLVREGIAMHQAGDLSGAERRYRDALALDPGEPDAVHFLGMLSCQIGNVAPGIALMEVASQLRPEISSYHSNLGNAYRNAGQPAKALAAYRRAVRCDSKSHVARINLGSSLWEAGQLDAALEQYQRAIALRGDVAEAHLGRGTVLKDLGLLHEAVASFDDAIRLSPGYADAHSNRLYTLNFDPEKTPCALFDAHLAWAREHADPLTSNAPIHTRGASQPDRRIKVGYVSPFFRDHAVNFFVEPILRHHDRSRFEVTCYSDVQAPDGVTQRLRSNAERWVSTAAFSDQALADRIREDGIDILVDLSGHMGANRLLAFARKPAPVQVTYLGYQSTTGLAAMDFRLTDGWADPEAANDAWHTEKLWRLLTLFFCYQPPAEAPPIVAPPCLKLNSITFGSFNIFSKVNFTVLETWAEILKQVPRSRLQLLVPDSPSLQARVVKLMESFGVTKNRLHFVPRAARKEYLKRYQTVDVALDPFPFNGHTTTCDALWMGLPVITMCGDSYLQRYGSAALNVLGLNSAIAYNRKEYIDAAVKWASDVPPLEALRQGLRQQMNNSAICDTASFTHHLEEAYCEMHEMRNGTAE